MIAKNMIVYFGKTKKEGKPFKQVKHFQKISMLTNLDPN